MAAKILSVVFTGWANAAALKVAFDAWAVNGYVICDMSTDWITKESIVYYYA